MSTIRRKGWRKQPTRDVPAFSEETRDALESLRAKLTDAAKEIEQAFTSLPPENFTGLVKRYEKREEPPPPAHPDLWDELLAAAKDVAVLNDPFAQGGMRAELRLRKAIAACDQAAKPAGGAS